MTPRSILTEQFGVVGKNIEGQRRAAQLLTISRYLCSFPKEIDAPATYANFCRYIESLPLSLTSIPKTSTQLEKLVLWVICIAQKPLDRITASDLESFIAFCKQPPESWIGAAKPRFSTVSDVEQHNLNWKPFRLPIAERSIGYLINKFFKYLSPTLGTQPRLPKNILISAPVLVPSQTDMQDAERYIAYLANLKSNKITVLRSMLIFSACYHLNIRFRELRADSNNFSMACFSTLSSSEPQFRMLGNKRDYNLFIPAALVAHIIQYRISLGLCAIPSINEKTPIMSMGVARKLMDRLVKMPGLETSLSALLDRAISARPTSSSIQEVRLTTCSEASRQYRIRWERRCALFGAGRAANSPDNSVSFHAGNAPLPIFHLQNEKVIVFSKKQSLVYVLDNFSERTAKSALKAMSLLRIYSHHSRDRLKFLAFEKLLLWLIYIKDKDCNSLTQLDAEEFYRFCLRPPIKWIGSSIQPRFLMGSISLVPNPRWTPFVRMRAEHYKETSRAARILDWCSSVSNSLLEVDAIRRNVFADLLK